MSIHEPPIISSEFTAFDERSYSFSVAQYHKLAEARIFQADDRVELLNGRIVRMSPIGPLHRRAVQRLTKLLERRLPVEWEVMVQQPIGLPGSEPQPDLSVVTAASAERSDGHPIPAEIALVVEVADSTLALDRGVKLPIYAAAGVREYWIVNLGQRQVEVYREPAASGPLHYEEGVLAATYLSRQDVTDTGELALTIDGQVLAAISAAEIFA